MMATTDEQKTYKFAQLGKWNLIKKLGTGATSRVYLAYDPVNKKYSAVKVIKRLNYKYIELTKAEFQLQSTLSHPHILSVIDYHETITLTDAEDKDQTVTAMVLENACGGDILKLIEKIGIFPEALARTYFHQIIDAIEYLSKRGIAHRDIKPENIMLDSDCCIKISDFGCASTIPANGLFKDPCGTSKYFPPEVHAGYEYRGIDVDLFATGIVVFCMVVGHMPFTKAAASDYLYSNFSTNKTKSFWRSHEDVQKKKNYEKGINMDFRNLITRMFDPTPSKRMKISEIKRSTWYNGPVLDRSEVISVIKSSLKKK